MDSNLTVKKKRGRPKKVQLPEEIQNLIELPKVESVKTLSNLDEKIEWDITKDDEITFFDARLSYELTGYRPINNEKGLDFNPSWFTEARETYKRTGHYCLFPRKSKAYNDFWTLLYIYCRDGMTINGYTVTGDHYFFLNYYQLSNLETAKAGEGRLMDFPTFYVALYEWFHYLELVKRLRKNAVLMKARGLGFSEMNAALAVNAYSVRRLSKTVIVANLAKYVEDTLGKAWNALSFLNDYTDGGFFKLRQVVDKADVKRASVYKMINGLKVESGFMSLIKGIVADSPNKVRGDRCDLLIYDEAGSFSQLTKAFIQGDALIGIQGARFGYKIAGGTGGDSGAKLEGLRTMYYNPNAFGILPYRHSYSLTGEEVLTAYFLPAFSIVKGEYMDSRGYTDPERGKAYYDKLRAEYINTPLDLVTFSAEFCYNAEEAFALEGENKFNKVLLAELLVQIRALKKAPKIETGFLEYRFKNKEQSAENINGFRWIPNDSGKIKILEHPIWTLEDVKDEHDRIVKSYPKEKLKGLYVIGIDGIDIGSGQTSDYTKNPSDFCLVVKKRVYGLDEPQYVAIYKDRPNDVREAYKTAIKLALYYNAIINIEATRLSIIPWAREKKLLTWFMKRPRATLTDSIRNTNKQYGTPATAAIIAHQTDLLADYINDYYHCIWFEEMLDELIRYTDENKRKFDIVAACAMAELADEELAGVVPKSAEVKKDAWQDIGYYTDDEGNRRWGVIPRKLNIRIQATIDLNYEDRGIRTSDPRVYLGYI